MKLKFNLHINEVPFFRDWVKPCLYCYHYTFDHCNYPDKKAIDSEKMYICYSKYSVFEEENYSEYFKPLNCRLL